MHEMSTAQPHQIGPDLADLERTLRASIAIMKRSRRLVRREPRPERPRGAAESRPAAQV